MEISSSTLKILKNFSAIANFIYVNEKNVLKITNGSSVIGIAEVEESFDQEFGIYNLSEFIQAISLFEKPEIEFNGGELIIKSGRRKVSYRLTPENLIPFKPKDSDAYKTGTKSGDGKFALTNDQLHNIIKSAKIFNCDILKVEMTDGKGTIHIYDSENNSENTYTEEIDGESKGEVSIKIPIDDIDFLPGDYDVIFKDSTFVKFQNKDEKVFYIITASTK